MINKRCNIMVVDKKEKYTSFFRGYRKSRFVINKTDTIVNYTDKELVEFNLFFVVLYEFRDLLEVFKICNFKTGYQHTSIIIGSENQMILKQSIEFDCFSVIDLSVQVNNFNRIHNSIKEVLN